MERGLSSPQQAANLRRFRTVPQFSFYFTLLRTGKSALRKKMRAFSFILLLSMQTHVSQGALLPEQSVVSKHLGGARTVRIYLPPSYDRSPKRRYPVLYLHDGQNVFSSAGTNCCFGWGSWELDKTVDALSAEKQMQEIIMVAVDNSRARYQEYRGPSGASQTRGEDRFQNYVSFLIKELKPSIDREYRTRRGAADTAVMGSSLGGICSLAVVWENSKTFGLAASLSGAFQIEKRYFLEKVLRPYKRKPKPIRIYLDSGTIDYTGDDDGRRNTDAIAAELRRIGWKEDINLKHFVDLKPYSESELANIGLRQSKWKEAQGSQHNEFY